MARRVRIQRSRPTPFAKNRKLLKTFKIGFGLTSRFLSAQRRIDIEKAKLERVIKQCELDEVNIAYRNNRVVLLDIEIEKKKVELELLKRQVGDPDAFADMMTDGGLNP